MVGGDVGAAFLFQLFKFVFFPGKALYGGDAGNIVGQPGAELADFFTHIGV